MAYIEYLLYGIPKGETERYTESLLTVGTMARIEAVRPIAFRDGFHSFRIATFNINDPSSKPDFARTLNLIKSTKE